MDHIANFYWLIGLLEGEGSFGGPPPSAPNQLRVEIEMKDRDVIARVATFLGSTMTVRNRYVTRAGNESLELVTSYRTRVAGRRAVRLLRTIHQHMSARRQIQIAWALSQYVPRTPKEFLLTQDRYEFTTVCQTTMCPNIPSIQQIWCADCVTFRFKER